MLIYHGVKLSQNELDKIEKNTNKIIKFFNVPTDVIVSITEEAKNKIKLTMSVIYKGQKVFSTTTGVDKIALAKEASDNIVRQIRKIKTSITCSKNSIKNMDCEGFNTSEPNILVKKIILEEMSDESAISKLKESGESLYIYRDKYNLNIIKIIIFGDDEKDYKIFEVYSN